jgi:hypothetical protein
VYVTPEATIREGLPLPFSTAFQSRSTVSLGEGLAVTTTVRAFTFDVTFMTPGAV